ncbi:MAG: YceI family protein [Actinomycetota bacterium]|nr:YceI family protein [Actinomycetota bacterium]
MTQTAQSVQELTGTYAVDPAHSTFAFVARHAMVTKVRGSFQEFDGTITIDGDDPIRSSGSLTIVAKSINTGNEQRDGHLRSNDFFDMDTYPEISFQSTGIEAVSENEYRVTGDLTIKDVTKSVTLDTEFTGAAVDPFGNLRIGFEAKTVVNRKNWGVNWNAPLEAGGVLVSEKVTIEVDISAIQQVA